MRGIFDLIGLAFIALLGFQAWERYQLKDEPPVKDEQVLAQMLSKSAPLMLGPMKAVRCERAHSWPWQVGQAMECQAEVGASKRGVALSIDVRVPVLKGAATFPFEIRKLEGAADLQVSAAVDRHEISPEAAATLITTRVRQVRLRLDDPKAGLAKALAEAERKQTTLKAWGER